jgi:cytochrome c2
MKTSTHTFSRRASGSISNGRQSGPRRGASSPARSVEPQLGARPKRIATVGNTPPKPASRTSPLLCFALVLFFSAIPLQAQLGDSTEGARLLREKNCTICHSIEGVGGSTAPDFARAITRSYTSATMAALLWNHGPAMWSAMRRENIAAGPLTEQDMRNIYVYFYALRYFDPPGDAARGRNVFTGKRCYRCHALTIEAGGVGPPVPLWPTLADPVLWVQQMWNHAGEMAQEMERSGIPWPKFTTREMVDMMVYVENQPNQRLRAPTMRLGDPSGGARLFESKNCSQCHTIGADDPNKVNLLETTQQQRRLTSLAVEMWNHRPLMEVAARNRGLTIATFAKDEMADLLAYLFERGYFAVEGDSQRGERVFRDKRCASCHGQADSAAPNLQAMDTTFTATRFAAAVWRHGPAMLAQMQQRGDSWPALSDRDVADLLAFLNGK